MKEVVMKEKVEPWHELVFICPGCGREFQYKSNGLHVRFCPECEKKSDEMSPMKRLPVKREVGSLVKSETSMTTG
jgi:hypothetical protein